MAWIILSIFIVFVAWIKYWTYFIIELNVNRDVAMDI